MNIHNDHNSNDSDNELRKCKMKHGKKDLINRFDCEETVQKLFIN